MGNKEFKFNKTAAGKIVLLSFFLFFFSVNGALADPPLPIGTSQGLIKYNANGNISIGGAPTDTARFQVVSSGNGSNTFAFKVLDTAGTTPIFTVRSDGVITIASSTTVSGPAVLQGSVQFSSLASSNLCVTANSSGFLATAVCGGGGATSTPASYITPGVFNSNAGNVGNYTFPGNLSINSAIAPTGGALYVNGSVGINKSNPATAVDVAGTVTATAFSGGGAGLTGVTAAAVPWAGITGKPTTLTGYGVTDVYAWAKTAVKPSYAFSEITGAATDAQIPDNITINTVGTVTAGQFVGGGAGITGITATDPTRLSKTTDTMNGALTVPSMSFTGAGGNSGQSAAVVGDYRIYQEPGAWIYPYPDLNIAYYTGIKMGGYWGYGGTRIYNNSDMVTELFSAGNNDNNVRVANNLYVTGTNTAAQFSGGGAGVTGVVAVAAPWAGVSGRPTSLSQFTNDSGYLSTNQTVTLTGGLTGSGTTAIAATMGVNPYYYVTAGEGNGLKFWNGSDMYKISMGTAAEYLYGPVTDYSIKNSIDSVGATRGFTWGQSGVAPIAAINVGNGNMQVAGSFTSTGGLYSSGNGNYAGRLADDSYQLGAGSMGAYTIYSYGSMCTSNSATNCLAVGGVNLGVAGLNFGSNIPNSGVIYFGYNGGGSVAIGKKTAATAVDVNGTVTATSFTGPGTNLTNTTKTHGTGWYLQTWQTPQFENLTWMNQYGGGSVINAADMIPGRIMRFNVYGEMYSIYGYAGQALNFRFDMGAAQELTLNLTYPTTATTVWGYKIEVTLYWTSTTHFIGTMQVIYSNATGGWGQGENAGTVVGVFDIANAAVQPYVWVYGSTYFKYSGRAYTIEYLN